MMLVDTIVKMDTVYTEKVNNYLTKGEVLDLFDKVHSFHNDEYTDFLSELGIIVTIVVIIAAFINYYHLESVKKRLDEDIKKFDERIERTIETKIKGRFDKEIEEKTELLRNEISIEINKLDSYHKGFIAINRATVHEKDGNYFKTYEFLLHALIRFIESERLEAINQTFDIVNRVSIILLKLEQKEFKFPMNLTKYTYLNTLIKLTNGKKEYEESMKKFINAYNLVNNIVIEEDEDEVDM